MRGRTLEKFFNDLALFVNTHGGHAHKNHAARSFQGDYLKGGGEFWDYEFFGKEYLYCFDAKEWGKSKLNLTGFFAKESNEKQYDTLRVISQNCRYAKCGFVFWFYGLKDVSRTAHTLYDRDYRLRFISIQELDTLMHDGTNAVNCEDIGEIFSISDMIMDCTGQNLKLFSILYPISH